MAVTQTPLDVGRGETINLRAIRKKNALIDQAAEALGRSRSDFMLDIVCREAASVLLDRRYFVLSEEAFRKFTVMLDRTPKDNPKLRRLLATQGASRTYVIYAGTRVAGYYSLAIGAATDEQVSGRIKRNMLDPVMILGRLTVDKAFQGKGIGTGLLKDALLRTMQAAEIAGIRALLVHAISDAAKRFYEAYGFIASPVDPMTVMITLIEAERVLLSGKD